jgi:hypothetical protein
MLKRFCALSGAAAILLSGACTVHQTEIPEMTGPSEFAQAFLVSATPDAIMQDGSSASTITVRASGPNGAPLVGAEVHLTSSAGSQFGSLSATTVFTGRDGRATATYTAPLAPPFLAGGPPTVVHIYATPVGSNYQASQTQSAYIQVTPPPAPSQGPGAPTAVVVPSTTGAKVHQLITFDASGSSAAAGHSIVSYYWSFGDALPQDEHGNDASHAYESAGTYTMVFGVVDDLGRIGSAIQTIVVTN